MQGQHSPYASALRAGVRVGPRGRFSNQGDMAVWTNVYNSTRQISSHFFGPWANGGKGVKNRYLGFKFQIQGKTHFGWARLNVQWNRGFIGTLTGYAYETIPNKPIIAGQTKGPHDEVGEAQPSPASRNAPNPEPATLGVLALGAPGLSIWKREEPVAATTEHN
jgi:hypothetical protein